ncbi:hypothetical protein FACS1894139_09040 [Planctomycetales bacterium]|nr:hypothetical protein FACS1894107_11910 [Planctomycetales bacterium]GHS98127.1 hypothetical protein FACS1894108_05710 [Planctomycetales bacterium]GHT05359.1 hypothetical protein FACS1894139_09040 [Planctomycetales bacterium]
MNGVLVWIRRLGVGRSIQLPRLLRRGGRVKKEKGFSPQIKKCGLIPIGFSRIIVWAKALLGRDADHALKRVAIE